MPEPQDQADIIELNEHLTAENKTLKAEVEKLKGEKVSFEKAVASKVAEFGIYNSSKPSASSETRPVMNAERQRLAEQYASIKNPTERARFWKANREALTIR